MPDPPLDDARRQLEAALQGAEPRPRKQRRPAPTPPQRFWRGARRPGAVTVVLGTLMVGLNVQMILTKGVFFPKGLAVAIVTLGFGVLALGFPGSVDLPAFTTRPPPAAAFWAGLSPDERFAWAVGMGGTFVLALGFALGL